MAHSSNFGHFDSDFYSDVQAVHYGTRYNYRNAFKNKKYKRRIKKYSNRNW